MKRFANSTIGLVWVSLCLCLSLDGQVTIVLKSLPDNTPDDAELYLAGSMQGWNPGSEAYKFELNGGVHRLTIHPKAGTHEYKVTRGSWDRVEVDAEGASIANRFFTCSGKPVQMEIEVAGWSDVSEAPVQSTACEHVRILEDAFYMPQLDRTRRIWIYLPPDYDTSSRSYPVLYLHDGQNVFDAATSYAGEWRVDESLDSLFNLGDYGCIVVAVDNGGTLRLDEYAPWESDRYGGGQGEAYVDFLVETLKPRIDSTYRTLPGRAHTGILGSSMGGLISLYAGLAHPDVFGMIGSFSPAYWFSSQTHAQAVNSHYRHPLRIYTVVGALEGEQYVDEVELMHRELIQAGHNNSDLQVIIHQDGNHREWYWAREFPKAYLWLFAGARLKRK